MGEGAKRWIRAAAVAGLGLMGAECGGQSPTGVANQEAAEQAVSGLLSCANEKQDAARPEASLPEIRGSSLAQELSSDNSMVQTEYARISKQEHSKVYQRRFNNSDAMLERGFRQALGDEEYRFRLISSIKKYSAEYGVPLDIALGVMGQESGGDASAVSEDGQAVGLMQLRPVAARKHGLIVNFEKGVDERYDADRNLRAGLAHLRTYYDQFGSWGLAEVAYCEGEGQLQRQLSRLFPEITHYMEENVVKNKNIKPAERKNWLGLFTPAGWRRYRELVAAGEINLVEIFSRNQGPDFHGRGLGATHPWQYPFWTQEMAVQMRSVLVESKIVPVQERLGAGSER